MDSLWTCWKRLFCGDEQRAYISALFVKNCLCCARNVYRPLPCSTKGFAAPFIVRGSRISAVIYNHSHIDVDDDKMMYGIYDDEMKTTSYDKEETTQFRVCCGCTINDPEHDYYSLKERPRIRTEQPHEHGHAIELGLAKMAELQKECDNKVAVFKITSKYMELGENKGKKFSSFTKALEENHFVIPFLILNITLDNCFQPWVDLTDFRHLALKTDKPVTLSDKILRCGVLSVNAPITNIKDLNKFSGNALIIGRNDHNGLGFERMKREIEKWRSDARSSLELFGLFQNYSASNTDPLAIYKEHARQISHTGELIHVLPEPTRIDLIYLNAEKDTAMLFVMNRGVCFVRGGVDKWIHVLDTISETLV